jgi:hypothetical protein
MRLAHILAAALVIILCDAGIASARDQIGQSDPIAIDPQKSYIFFRTHFRSDVRFLLAVTETQRAAQEVRRQAAFVSAQTLRRQEVAQWQSEFATCHVGHGSDGWCEAHMHRPDDVTPETFAFPPPEMESFIDVRSGPQFTRAGGDFTYLIAVPPGVYTLYGQVSIDGNGTTGVCVCMGSVSFEAPAGRIVDLGTIRYPLNEAVAAGRVVIPGVSGLSSHALVPPDASTSLPDRLTGLPVIPAAFRAADKMPNYYGVAVNRLEALPGVLAYHRDRVIDVRTGNPVDASVTH